MLPNVTSVRRGFIHQRLGFMAVESDLVCYVLVVSHGAIIHSGLMISLQEERGSLYCQAVYRLEHGDDQANPTGPDERPRFHRH